MVHPLRARAPVTVASIAPADLTAGGAVVAGAAARGKQ